MKTFALAALLLTALPSFAASAGAAAPKPYDGIIRYEKYHADYEVNPDGTHTETHDVLIDVLTEEGIKSANEITISYSESLQKLEILSAYTLKKDGRRIEVPASNIQERSDVAGGGPMYSDIKAKVIIFPDVAVGDKVGYTVRLVQTQAIFPGNFSMALAFSKLMAYEDVRIRVSVPKNSLSLYAFAPGIQGGPAEDKEGRSRWVWTYKNREIAAPEYGAVDPIDYSPLLVVSSFKDYGALAAAYEERARPKAAVTERVRKLADELTRGVTDQREQARLLYTWVVKNIHYAGNRLGVGPVVPHDTDTILDNRLGDCKDHATLMQALLAAKSIESTAVLINGGASYKLPPVPAISVFNHVINYIPALDLYLDSTAEYTPFGLLPLTEYGKPVVQTARFAGIRETPLNNYKTTISSLKMAVQVHDDGSADGETTCEETGALSSTIRAYLARVAPNQEDLVVRKIIAASGFSGTGTLTKEDPHALSDRYRYGLTYHLADAMNAPGPGAAYVVPVLSHALPIAASVNSLNQPEPKQDHLCIGGISTEEYTIDLPKSIKIISLPGDMHLAKAEVRYDATYRRQGNRIAVSRRFEDRTPGPTCTPQDLSEFRPVALDIQKDLRAQIVYGPATGSN